MPYIKLGYILEASYSAFIMSVSKKSSVDQSELEKYVVSDCKTNYRQYNSVEKGQFVVL